MNAKTCTHCLAGDLSIVCEETTCPFLPLEKQAGTQAHPGTRSGGEQGREMSDWEAERLRQEHDAMWCLAWGFICLLAALFTVGCLVAGGCLWGGGD